MWAKAGRVVVFNHPAERKGEGKYLIRSKFPDGLQIAMVSLGIRSMSLSRFLLTSVMMAAAVSAQDPGAQQAPPDEPGRPVARLSVLSGDASVRRGDSGEWVAAALNAPLMAGDSISVAAGGAAELQLDYANFVRIAGDSEVRISDLENGHYQIQLAKGLLTYRILKQANTQPEISTALIAVRPVGLSAARVEVFPDGTTRVTVRHGQVEIYTPKGTEHASEGNVVTVRGSVDDPEYQMASAGGPDQWDSWSDQRDAYLNRSQSARYVSQDIAGAEDLDAYGQWSNDPAYGNVWTPRVAANWAPYRNGQWVWEDYYGWTWVDADPWGWAPFHYGSWYQRAGFGWCWYPGERFHHNWYRPALVGFVGFGGGFGVGFGFGNVGWIPLAPFEVFHPWYGRGFNGREGFGGRAIVINNTNVTNIYRNSRSVNGVTAVSAADFQRGNFRNQVPVNSGQLQQASLVRGAVPITPRAENLRFTDRPASAGIPRSDMQNQRFFSRSGVTGGVGAAQRTPFTQQQAAVRSTIEGQRFGGVPNNGSTTPRGNSAPGWQRFGNPQAGTGQQFSAPQQQRFSGANPSSEGSRGFYGNNYSTGGSRSLQVAPPIVQQRQAPQYYDRGGGFGAPSYRGAPAPSSRSEQPAYRAPQQSYRSAPAPSYRSAPAPSYHGGGGSSSGGGHTNSAPSGGHGGRQR
ncbi:MAG: FecR family protein [Acidobacteriota bacterium]|nr:FecR family protein [Acidobacteriota bacterium]